VLLDGEKKRARLLGSNFLWGHRKANGMYAAGVLPYTFYQNTLYFLVGKDIRDNSWSDFGGKAEAEDKDTLDTAMREFYEETCGVVMDLKALKARFAGRSNRVMVSATQNGHPYYMYALQVPFTPHLRSTYRKLLAFMRYRKLYKKNIEKTDMQWVCLDDLLIRDRLTLRSVFASTVRRHAATLRLLAPTAPGGHSFAGSRPLPPPLGPHPPQDEGDEEDEKHA